MKLTNLHLEIHFLLFLGLLIAGVVAGYLLGRMSVSRLQRRVLEVEDEMLLANKEVLRYVEQNKQLTEALEKANIPLPKLESDEEKARKYPLGKIG
ncbi:MAG TPA: hypothetical protein PKE07_01390 [Lacibacter sp.]|nr:hypothetical protein [Lacibacter sp.]HMO88047.1 hypothetical protein [Lacibacter sp.]